jgi:hypothetical protein
MWNKNVQHTLKNWDLCCVPLPPFILIIIQCLYAIMLLSDVKRVFIHSSFQSSLCLFIHWNISVFIWAVCISWIGYWSCNRGWLPPTHLSIIYLFSLFAHFHSWLRRLLVNIQWRIRSSQVRIRSSLVVRASDCQCTSCNGPGFDPSIHRHSGIWGAADEAVLNIVRTKRKKSPPPKKKIKKKYSMPAVCGIIWYECLPSDYWLWQFHL